MSAVNDMCDIPDDVRRELGMVHADAGTYIDLNKMQTMGYASINYMGILDTLKTKIPGYDFNFAGTSIIPLFSSTSISKTNLGDVVARNGACSVVRDDFHAFFVHLIDNEKHVIRPKKDQHAIDDRHAIKAITVQLWDVVARSSTLDIVHNGKVIYITPYKLFPQFEAILKKHAAIANGLRKQSGLVPICIHGDQSDGPILRHATFFCADCVMDDRNGSR